MAVVDGLRLAVGTLTILPVKPPAAQEDGSLSPSTVRSGVLLMPLVGLALALVVALVATVYRVLVGSSQWWTSKAPIDYDLDMRRGFALLLGAAVAIALLAWLTRGLHLDGLADTADGLGVRGDADRRLDAMRRPEVGAFGVVTLVFIVLLQVLALAECMLMGHGTEALIVAVVTGRLSIVWACRRGIPAARPGGLGAAVAGVVPTSWAWLVTALVLALTVAVFALDDDRSGRSGAFAVAGVVAGLLAGAWMVRRCVARFGGITGDVLGASTEISTTAVLLVLAIT